MNEVECGFLPEEHNFYLKERALADRLAEALRGTAPLMPSGQIASKRARNALAAYEEARRV